MPERTRPDEVRLLNRSGSGYTPFVSRAMDPREPEAVNKESQQRFSDTAQREQADARQQQRAAMAEDTLTIRLRRCIAMAKHLKVDCHQDLRIIRLAITGGRSTEHIARRLDKLEARLMPDLPGTTSQPAPVQPRRHTVLNGTAPSLSLRADPTAPPVEPPPEPPPQIWQPPPPKAPPANTLSPEERINASQVQVDAACRAIAERAGRTNTVTTRQAGPMELARLKQRAARNRPAAPEPEPADDDT